MPTFDIKDFFQRIGLLKRRTHFQKPLSQFSQEKATFAYSMNKRTFDVRRFNDSNYHRYYATKA